MRFPSSIFNFDTLRPERPRLGPLLLAAAIVFTADFGIARARWPYRFFPQSYVAEFLNLEASLNGLADANPTVVILGNSRSQAGISALELEQCLGLPRGGVLNLSMSAAGHYDNRLLQTRNRDVIRRASILVCCVDAYQWNRGFPLRERFSHFAGLADRWRLQPTPECLAGGVVRMVDKPALIRALPGRMLAAARHARSGSDSSADASTALTPESDLAGDRPAPAESVEDSTRWVKSWYRDFSLSARREIPLRELIADARRDGQQVVLVQLPFSDRFLRFMEAVYAEDYRNYRRAVDRLPDVRVLAFEKAADCGLTDADFADTAHLNDAGATIFSRVLAEELRADLPRETTPPP